MCFEIRPSNRTLFVPACAENGIVPAMTMRAQGRLLLFFLIGATHVVPTLRPLAGSVNVNSTRACSLRSKENVVPILGFSSLRLLTLNWASRLPSRQISALSLSLLIVGDGGDGGSGAGSPPPAACPGPCSLEDMGVLASASPTSSTTTHAVADAQASAVGDRAPGSGSVTQLAALDG